MQIRCYTVLCVMIIIMALKAYPDDQGFLEEEKVILLSTPRSGTNLTIYSLMTIIKRPIGRYPDAIQQYSPRLLNIEFISDVSFLYRTHDYQNVVEAKADQSFNKMILVTRNPKELLFRDFKIKEKEDLHKPAIQKWIDRYLKNLEVYDDWNFSKRFLVFYDDLASNLSQIFYDLTNFIMPTTPVFFQDFFDHQQESIEKIYASYIEKRQADSGASAIQGFDIKFYTRNRNLELLRYIDEVFKNKNPRIWNQYLEQFKENPK